jgi:hypothetical protein
MTSEIQDFHGSENKDCGIVGCGTVQLVRCHSVQVYNLKYDLLDIITLDFLANYTEVIVYERNREK